MPNKISFSSIGDIGIDIYPDIQKRFPGGMALNSAYHAKRAGAQASVLSAIGNDKDGSFILDFLKKNDISASGLEILDGNTDTVEITLDTHARPQYGKWELGVLENYRLSSSQKEYLKTQDVVVSVFLPELRSMFDDFAQLNLPNTVKVGDFTDLSEFQGDQSVLQDYVESFDFFVLSIDKKVDERVNSFSDFINKNGKMGIALMGSEGSTVIFDNKKFHQDSTKTKVIDTTGAGDAYLATFLIKYQTKKNIFNAMKFATEVATKSIKHFGATI